MIYGKLSQLASETCSSMSLFYDIWMVCDAGYFTERKCSPILTLMTSKIVNSSISSHSNTSLSFTPKVVYSFLKFEIFTSTKDTIFTSLSFNSVMLFTLFF